MHINLTQLPARVAKMVRALVNNKDEIASWRDGRALTFHIAAGNRVRMEYPHREDLPDEAGQ